VDFYVIEDVLTVVKNLVLLDLTPEKYDICISIAVLDASNTGKISLINPPLFFHQNVTPINAIM